MNSFFVSILDIFFPRKCLFCGKLLLNTERTCCPECRKRYSLKGDERLTVYKDINIYSSFSYTKDVKGAVKKFKFEGKKHIAEDFANEMIATLLDYGYTKDSFDSVVYIPLPPERERQRGYNQAKELAKYIAEYFDTTLSSGGLLRRSIHLQHELKKSMRLKQEKSGFDIDLDFKVRGRILLVDDIVTTGSTVASCVKLLKTNGAESVIVTTFAKTC